MEGTYPLPEAQRDRFLYHIIVPFPAAADLMEIARREATAFHPQLVTCFDAVTLAQVRQIAQQILVAEHILTYASMLVLATHPSDPRAPTAVRDGVRYGASPRAVQALIRTAQVEALRAGRLQVDVVDIQRVALPVLRHRIVLRREVFLANATADSIVALVLAAVPVP
jgi:MoxR-like ATPase